jgi:hypothetical protein
MNISASSTTVFLSAVHALKDLWASVISKASDSDTNVRMISLTCRPLHDPRLRLLADMPLVAA